MTLLLLKASIMVESLVFAVPVHRRLDLDAPHHAKDDLNRLVRLNTLRLAAASGSSAVAIYLLALVLT